MPFEKGRIVEIGDIKKGDAKEIYATGLTVMSGLIEGHNHPFEEREFSDPGFKKYYDNMVNSPALALMKGIQVVQGLLTRGITTVRIPHPTIANAPELRGEWLVALRKAVERRYFPAPRVVAGGCVLPTGGHLNSMAPPFALKPGWWGADGQFLVPTMGMFYYDPLVDAYEGAASGTRDEFEAMKPGLVKNFKTCLKVGVKIAAGTDNTYWDAPGVAWEIYTYVKQGGMKPMDAIISATKTNAENCVLPDVGTLEVGKKADLIFVDGDPLRDIKVLQDRVNIGTVIKEGYIIVEDGKINW